MLSFSNDYSECAHPKILERISAINYNHLSGYGCDEICDAAKEKIRAVCECPNAEIYFISGGTQTNQLIVDTCTAPYEGVISADTGHIQGHEAGAVEFTGHKILPLKSIDGKISAASVEQYLKDFHSDGNKDHMVWPGMVYISQPTEYGTLYSKEELVALHKVCQSYDIPLFADGARLISGIAAAEAPTLADMAENTDVFYIGGTKAGLLFGEAVVFTHNNAPAHFITRMKQHGALMAKGFVMGAMFDEMFTNDLYKELGNNAMYRALELRKILLDKGYKFYLDSPTNQTFIVVENEKLKEMSTQITYSFWEKYDENHTVIRLATSWATTKEDVEALKEIL